MDDDLTQRCEVTRRQALQVAVRGGAVLVCALLSEAPAEAGAAWVQVGRVADFKVGQPKRVSRKAGQAAFVLRQSNNRWLAVSTICTHKGGEVRWDPARKRFLCPLHLATFSADGKNPTSPARAPLPTYAAQAKGNSVLVDTAGAAPATAAGGRKGNEKPKHDEDEREEHEEHGSKGRHKREHGDADD